MRRLAIILALACLALPAYAETLDDASIRALYAEAATNVGDPQKTRAFMEQRLDEHYSVKIHLIQDIGGAPEQDATSNFIKVEVIENALRGYGVMQADHYKNRIVKIKRAKDGASVYVTDETVSSGTISVALPGGGYKAARYAEAESCVKQLGMVGGTLKFLQGACNEKFAVKE